MFQGSFGASQGPATSRNYFFSFFWGHFRVIWGSFRAPWGRFRAFGGVFLTEKNFRQTQIVWQFRPPQVENNQIFRAQTTSSQCLMANFNFFSEPLLHYCHFYGRLWHFSDHLLSIFFLVILAQTFSFLLPVFRAFKVFFREVQLKPLLTFLRSFYFFS